MNAKPRQRMLNRTHVVWLTFLAAMAVVSSLLLLFDNPASGDHGGLIAMSTSLDDRAAELHLTRTAVPLDRERWQAIVIHHSGSPAGDGDSITGKHVDQGRGGLGYHFIIGNGNGLGDGLIHVGTGWDRQMPGLHAIGPNRDWLNRHAIGVCLIGNGNARPMTERQLRRVVQLVQRLQREFDIPANRVYLHRDVADVVSPGRHFPEADFRSQLHFTGR